MIGQHRRKNSNDERTEAGKGETKANKQTTVLFIWKPSPELKRHLKNSFRGLDSLKLIFPERDDENAYLKYASEADVIVGWRPTEQLLNKAVNLKLFINPGAGVQHLIEMFNKTGLKRRVTLVNGHGNSFFVAQHAVAMLLALLNRIVLHHNTMAAGRWYTGDGERERSTPLRGRRVGFLGYGEVNRKVHQLLMGFDVAFSALRMDWSKQQTSTPTPLRRYTTHSLKAFLQNNDILIIALPLTPKTRGLIGKREISYLPDGAVIVNVGRGDVIDEGALYEALKTRKLGGAAIDVWYINKPTPDGKGRLYPYRCPFHELDDVILSPHRAASPFNDLKRWDDVTYNIRTFAAGKKDFINIVDFEKGY